VANYSVLIKRSAAKEIGALPAKDRRRVVTRFEGLAENLRPPGGEKLSGAEKYRLRQGDYRILYDVVDRNHIVTVIAVGNRRDVYR
jgi:mRNA interferase RelE/StbE